MDTLYAQLYNDVLALSHRLEAQQASAIEMTSGSAALETASAMSGGSIAVGTALQGGPN
jgi:hypothetical protein